MKKLTWIVAAAFAVGLIAAGCGGDDNDGNDDASTNTGTEASTLTHQQFVTQANQICKEGNAEIDAAGNQLQAKPGTPEFESFVTDTLVPNVQGQIDDIRSLGIPDEDADQVNSVLDEAEQITNDIADDPSKVQGDPYASINKQLTDLGLTECAG
jgi:hypothetical protein